MRFLLLIKKQDRFFVFLLFLALPIIVFGQSRKNLESKRKDILYEIRKTDDLLRETSKNKELTYEKFITLKKQIENRKELVKTIQEELSYYDESLERTADVIESMNEDILRLKKDYDQLLRFAYRRKLMKSDLLFLFSAQSFNDAFKRWQYLKQYDKYRKKQAYRIIQTQKSLEKKIQKQEERKEEKERLLSSEKSHLLVLEHELTSKNKLLKQLKREEKKLRKKISKKKKAHEQLNIAIEGIIQEGVISQRAESRKPKVKIEKANPSSTSNRMLSGDFKSNKGKFPWPVQGVVSSHYGKQAHPTLPDITINNSGIDILTTSHEKVKPIASGVVAAVRFVPGNDYLVIVQHGNYYTLYSKLEEHYVKKGDKVSPNDELGKVRTDGQTGKSELHFEIWKQQTRMNPKWWLSKK